MWVSNEGILATLPLYNLPMEFPEILKAKSGNIYRVLFTLELKKKFIVWKEYLACHIAVISTWQTRQLLFINLQKKWFNIKELSQ